MGDTQQKTDKKKVVILAAANDLFRHYPPSKVGIRDIAMKANVSVVTIYNHFQSKERLVLELIKQVVNGQIEVLKDITDSDSAFETKIETIVFKQSQLVSSFHPEFVNLMVSDPEISKYLTDIYQETLMKLFTDVIAHGKAEGYIDPILPDSLVISIMQLFNKDIQSKDSVLLSNHHISDIHTKILEIMIYGFSGKTRIKRDDV
ncbi:TetR/AcrR family transcriptional regulator [Clostridium sp. BSD9I1]|uniref:TetR/AcrR family transcriptional regulator n=1 Tax=Clostridium sp. BSD9I1 TaxID=2003589 RepID=UPI0016495D30|nr:TetR/AcrR family transcriptional regulator [Clostridium sp. BSD9I1]